MLQSGTDAITKHKKEHKYSIFSKKFLRGKKISGNADANADSNDNVDAEMPMSRFPNGLFLPFYLFWPFYLLLAWILVMLSKRITSK